MKKIYVATSFQNIPEARAVMEILQKFGHSITHDWTQDFLQPEWTPEEQDAYLQNSGAKDYAGVVAADAVVLINHVASRDAMTEFGIALGRGAPVFVLYPERRPSVFFHMATTCKTVLDLIEHLNGVRP